MVKRPIKSPEALGRTLRDARKQLGWTQEALAERAGVTQATVSTFERGEGNPTFATVLALASAVGLNLVAELRTKSGRNFPWERTGSGGAAAGSEDESSRPA